MPPTTLERLRIPAALVLIALVAIVLWPRGGGEGDPGAASGPSPSPGPSRSVVVGDPGGEAVPASVPPAVTPIPTVADRQTPEPTPAPTEAPPPPTPPPAADGFTAEVLVCQSISGPQCNDQLQTVPANLSSFTTLVRFTAANAGDALSVALTGPSGTTPGSPYTLQGGGDGYYYSTFSTAGLRGGVYTVTATRNGALVATTEFRKAGG